MLQRMVLVACCVLMPNVGWAQSVQENYLPSKSQLYFRWDGMQTHRPAFEKTAVGKMMKGETGKFLDEFWSYTQEQALNAARNQPKIEPALKDFTKLLGSMYNYGLVLGVEVDTVLPPALDAVLVFPKGAGESGTLLPLIQKVAEEANAEVKNTKVGKRLVNAIHFHELVSMGWWAQGEDAVLYLGTRDPVDYAKAIDTKKTGLASNPLYKKVASFKEFSTCQRGYFDMASVLNVASEAAPQAKEIINLLGLKGIKNMTFFTGFDGPGERSIVDVEIVGPRTGVLSMGSQKKLDLKELPKLPNDIYGFSAGTINITKSYDTITGLIEGVVRVFDANKADDLKEGIKAFEGTIGIDVSKDLFGSFGDTFVSYSSPTDGFLGTGAVVAVQIKDGKKLTKTIEKIVKAIPANPGGEITLKKTAYRGGEIIQLQMTGGQINNHFATIGIYKDWFIYTSYPQAVKGFILRQEGELPAWKADKSLTDALEKFPKDYTGIAISDPRPAVQTVLSITPFAINMLNTFGSLGGQFGFQGFRPFDLELIPHAQEATRHLFPNVTITTDDGKRLRLETRGSLLFSF